MARIDCQSCGDSNEEFVQFCIRCGTEIVPDSRIAERTQALPAEAALSGEDETQGGRVELDRSDLGEAGYLSGVSSAQLASAWGRLIQVREDGSDGPSYPLVGDAIVVGRTEADLCFAHDQCMEKRSFSIHRRDDRVILEPEPGGLNGVFVCVREPTPLNHGDSIRIGHQRLDLELFGPPEGDDLEARQSRPLGNAPTAGTWGCLRQRVTETVDGFIFPLMREEMTLGRVDTDIVFSHDPFVSSEHARLLWDGEQAVLIDQHSRNGSFIRAHGPIVLFDGHSFLAGQHLFKFRA